jgi:superfamily I DNA/RNA helicase
MSIKDIIINILGFLDINSLKNAFSQYKREAYFRDLMNRLCGELWKEYHEWKNWTKVIEEIEGINSIPIMTIHKSKGLEYDTVVFVGLEDGAFWSFKNQQEEDTNAFFVALSRAKKRVIFTFSEVRTSLRYANQSKEQIKTFYDLLHKTQIVDEKLYVTKETENGLEVAVTHIKYN